MDDSPARPIELSQYDYAWDEGHFWNELASLFNRASSSSSPRKDSSGSGNRHHAPAASFDDFQQSINDAWDLGDDEFCVISGKLSYAYLIFKN